MAQHPLLFPEPEPELPRLPAMLWEAPAFTPYGGASAPGFEPETRWTVRTLVAAVTRNLEDRFRSVHVEGEISNCRPGGTGHVYFTLREGDAQIQAVMFRKNASLLPFKLENGLHVLLRGKVTVYEQRGQLQMIVDVATPLGDGARLLAFEQLRNKLREEGLFAPERKKPLPSFPRCIGVVTSPQGAVIHDIIRILQRRYSGSRVLLYPAAVQGPFAVDELRAGIRWFAAHPQTAEVIVLARGGGSWEDLAAFNDETLARAIAICPIPVVSAVGHETDQTIADFVADMRAPTPSAAAEILTAQQHQVSEKLHSLTLRVQRATRYRVSVAKERLSRQLARPALASSRDFTWRHHQKLDELIGRAADAQRARLHQVRREIEDLRMRLAAREVSQTVSREQTRLQNLQRSLVRAVAARIAAAKHAMAAPSARLRALSPEAVLQRGYALVYAADGLLVRSVAQVSSGNLLRTRLADGEVRSTVLEMPEDAGAARATIGIRTAETSPR